MLSDVCLGVIKMSAVLPKVVLGRDILLYAFLLCHILCIVVLNAILLSGNCNVLIS